MKKLLLLFVVSGLIFTTSSCKKEEDTSCPEPEVWGVGTWKASKVLDDNGNEVDPNSNPYFQCYINSEQFTLNDNHNGDQWIWADIDPNTNSCAPVTLNITSWAENLNTKRLYVTTNNSDYGSFEFFYTNDRECYLDYGYKFYYEKQNN